MTETTGGSTLQDISLSITFSGPLLFDFHQGSDTTVDIFAPYCPYHAAGIFFSYSSQSETDLWKCVQPDTGQLPPSARAYSIYGDGISANANAPTIISPTFPPGLFKSEISPFLSTKKFGQYSLRSDKALFRITAPRPEMVCPLYFDSVEVVPDYNPGSITGNMSPYPTGLRFFYRWDAGTAVQLKLPRNLESLITPPVFDGVPTLADIEFRYQGLDLADENDTHSDARSCFASLATLAGMTCWLNYGDGKSCPTNPSPTPPEVPGIPPTCQGVGRLHLLSHTGGDCHAPVIVNGLDV